MPYSPPLVKPPLSPLRPPAPLPFRPPGPIRLPPTQTAPIFSPPTLLPPTGRDLKGTICIYANTPIWEPKKIRYRYPGEIWQEIAGETYSIEIDGGWNPLPLDTYLVVFSAQIWWWGTNLGPIATWSNYAEGGFRLESIISETPDEWTGRITRVNISTILATLKSRRFLLWDRNGTRPLNLIGPSRPSVEYEDFACDKTYMPSWLPIIPSALTGTSCSAWPWITLNLEASFHNTGDSARGHACRWGSIKIDRVVRVSDNQEIPPNNQCTFKVFNVFNQEILSITRDVCPEVIVVPERCYYKAENERLVRKVDVGFFQNLRTEYNGNCATVWLDAPPLPFATEIFKECSDNPSCPPPRIRFDKKCKEKCEQCPPGTAIKVLLGGNIACVDSVGCVLKIVKYKPGCNNYDCICI